MHVTAVKLQLKFIGIKQTHRSTSNGYSSSNADETVCMGQLD